MNADMIWPRFGLMCNCRVVESEDTYLKGGNNTWSPQDFLKRVQGVEGSAAFANRRR